MNLEKYHVKIQVILRKLTSKSPLCLQIRRQTRDWKVDGTPTRARKSSCHGSAERVSLINDITDKAYIYNLIVPHVHSVQSIVLVEEDEVLIARRPRDEEVADWKMRKFQKKIAFKLKKMELF